MSNDINKFLAEQERPGGLTPTLDNQPREARNIMHNREAFRESEDNVAANLMTGVGMAIQAPVSSEERRSAAIDIASRISTPGQDVSTLLAAAAKVEAWLRGDSLAPGADLTPVPDARTRPWRWPVEGHAGPSTTP